MRRVKSEEEIKREKKNKVKRVEFKGIYGEEEGVSPMEGERNIYLVIGVRNLVKN